MPVTRSPAVNFMGSFASTQPWTCNLLYQLDASQCHAAYSMCWQNFLLLHTSAADANGAVAKEQPRPRQRQSFSVWPWRMAAVRSWIRCLQRHGLLGARLNPPFSQIRSSLIKVLVIMPLCGLLLLMVIMFHYNAPCEQTECRGPVKQLEGVTRTCQACELTFVAIPSLSQVFELRSLAAERSSTGSEKGVHAGKPRCFVGPKHRERLRAAAAS